MPIPIFSQRQRFLSGWGLLTIWRLDAPNLQVARQALWLGISIIVFLLGLRLPTTLELHPQI